MPAILFTCPNTRSKVQHWIPDDDPLGEREHVGVVCEGCSRVHFVDRSGRVFRAAESATGVFSSSG